MVVNPKTTTQFGFASWNHIKNPSRLAIENWKINKQKYNFHETSKTLKQKHKTPLTKPSQPKRKHHKSLEKNRNPGKKTTPNSAGQGAECMTAGLVAAMLGAKVMFVGMPGRCWSKRSGLLWSAWCFGGENHWKPILYFFLFFRLFVWF